MKLLQQCEVCDKQFSWKSVFKSLMYGYMPIYCTECKIKHRATIGSRIRVTLTIFLIVLLGKFMPTSIADPFPVPILIIFAILVILFAPFLTRYHAHYGGTVEH